MHTTSNVLALKHALGPYINIISTSVMDPNLWRVYKCFLAGFPTTVSLTMISPLRPPHDGSLTVVPGFVDFHAQHNPDLPWAKFPSRTHPGQAETISFIQFAQATHRVAHKVRPHRQGSDGEVVTLLIHCDTILYVTTLVGLMRANVAVSVLVLNNSINSMIMRICSLYRCLQEIHRKLLRIL